MVNTKPVAVNLRTIIDAHMASTAWQRHFYDRSSDGYHYWKEVEIQLQGASIILTELIKHLEKEGE